MQQRRQNIVVHILPNIEVLKEHTNREHRIAGSEKYKVYILIRIVCTKYKHSIFGGLCPIAGITTVSPIVSPQSTHTVYSIPSTVHKAGTETVLGI